MLTLALSCDTLLIEEDFLIDPVDELRVEDGESAAFVGFTPMEPYRLRIGVAIELAAVLLLDGGRDDFICPNSSISLTDAKERIDCDCRKDDF